MELYVGPLTARDTVSQLQRFFKGFNKKASFNIIKLIRNSGPYYFGLVNIESDRLAAKAIKKLHACKLNDHRVAVREYEHRASSNDRRSLNWRNSGWDDTERRNDERREQSRRTNSQEPEFDGYANMSVKHL